MADQSFRSSYEAPAPRVAPKRTVLRKMAVIPVALTAVTSMIFTTQSAVADEAPAVNKLPKAKGSLPPASTQSSHLSAAATLSDKYTIVEGDTVRSIAQLHNVSSAELLAANGLSWKTMIFAGQQLNIPASSNGTESAEIGESITRHSVISGETLEGIARQYSVGARAIMSANGLDRSSRLVVGQRLVIPDAHLMSALPAVASA